MFNALAKKVQNTIDTKHTKPPTHYKDKMRPQQAIRSNTEHICTTMFTRRRILRVFHFGTRRWPPQTNSITGCFIRPQTHIHNWKLEWINCVNTPAHSAAGQRRALVRNNTNQFTSQTDYIILTVRHVKETSMNKWKQDGQLKKYCSGSSVITPSNPKNASFFISHLAFNHIMTEIWALFVSSVDSSTSAAINGTALISIISNLITHPLLQLNRSELCLRRQKTQ